MKSFIVFLFVFGCAINDCYSGGTPEIASGGILDANGQYVPCKIYKIPILYRKNSIKFKAENEILNSDENVETISNFPLLLAIAFQIEKKIDF